MRLGLRLALAFLVVPFLFVRSEAQPEDPEWLYVIQGTVTDIAADRLVLDAGQTAVAFTDRPERQVAFVSLEELTAQAWGEDGTYRSDPPNAALVDESGETVAVITIVDASVVDGVLVLAIAPLQGELPEIGDVIALVLDPSGSNDPGNGAHA